MAIDAKQGVQLRGTRWSAPFATPVTNGPMSCVSVATCRFVATDGGVVTVTNGVAGSTTYLDPLGGPNIIDCATASFCLVGALFGIVYTGT